MRLVIVLFLVLLLREFVFWLTHRDPLTEDEIRLLSQKRRISYILQKYDHFTHKEVRVDKSFKSKLEPNGRWYELHEPLRTFPSFVAGLLKYKKHEWVVIALEKDGAVIKIWVEKGTDNGSVSFSVTLDEIIRISEEIGACTAMRFHNHPNPDPQHYDCLMPSDQDIVSAAFCSSFVNKAGVNWLDFVCERGRFQRYYVSISPDYIPPGASVEEIKDCNGVSPCMNYRLHMELRLLRFLSMPK